MLHLLGLLLKAIITIAIGIMGFTWEPKQEIKAPQKKEDASDMVLPVYLIAPVQKPLVIEANLDDKNRGCNDSQRVAIIPQMPKRLRERSVSI